MGPFSSLLFLLQPPVLAQPFPSFMLHGLAFGMEHPPGPQPVVFLFLLEEFFCGLAQGHDVYGLDAVALFVAINLYQVTLAFRIKTRHGARPAV
mmetsp:Transcript_29994/g.56078  ORF Transcript_29994/g.56078 Transcript_29994/m.56078 type:complete len:94 (-) Transcript_29994:526-807(-)